MMNKKRTIYILQKIAGLRPWNTADNS